MDLCVALELSDFKYDLLIDGVTKLNQDIFEQISNFKATSISISGIKSLSKENAESISKFKGKFVRIDGIEKIDHLLLSGFISYPGSISLGGINTINKSFAKDLSMLKCKSIIMDNLVNINDDTFEELLKLRGKLLINQNILTDSQKRKIKIDMFR